MFLTQTTGSASNNETLLGIVLIVSVIILIVGFLKRTMWICVCAAIIAGFIGITQPQCVDWLKTTVTSVIDGGIEPLKDEDYVDMVGEDNFNNHYSGFENIGKDDIDKENDNNDK